MKVATNERRLARLAWFSIFATYVTELIVQTDIVYPVNWNFCLIPATFYVAVLYAAPGAAGIARFSLIASTFYSFAYNLQYILGPCGVSSTSLQQRCSNASLENRHECLLYLERYRVADQQRRCPWTRLGGVGTAVYVIFFAVRVGIGCLAPAVLHALDDSRVKGRLKLRDPHAIGYSAVSAVVVAGFLIEVFADGVDFHKRLNVEPPLLYLISFYVYYRCKREQSRDLELAWLLLVQVTLVYTLTDFFRNLALHFVGKCDLSLSRAASAIRCSDDDCWRDVTSTSESLSELSQCPEHRLDVGQAAVIRNCEYVAFASLVFHCGSIVAFQRLRRSSANENKNKIAGESN